ncbi:MAG: hypothetical protein ACREA2_18210 [Blastocatellia bacterium]
MSPEAIKDFARRVAGSRIGLLLAFVHFCLVVYGFAQKEPVELGGDGPFDITRAAGVSIIAGRAFHWHYESTLLKVISLIDLPGTLPAFLMSLPLTLIFYVAGIQVQSIQVQSWIGAVILLFGTSIQWWLVGYALHRIWNRR